MSAARKISYGLFIVTVNDGKRHSGCICNTVVQLTTSPNRVSLTLNKANYTTEVLQKTKKCNVSILAENADFELFKRFGFCSGRDTDKFANLTGCFETGNYCKVVTAGCNSFMCLRIVQEIDLGSHIHFIAEVMAEGDISDVPSATYAYYHAHIKPQPQPKTADKTVWRCKICNYEYEGEELPADFICPLCKHGAEDFEKI